MAVREAQAKMLQVQRFEDSPDVWDRFILQSQAGLFFHQYGWRDVVAGSYGHEPIYLAARKDHQIVGVLPLFFFNSWLSGKALISVPHADYAGILSDDPTAMNALADEAARIAAQLRCKYVEFRHLGQQLLDLPTSAPRVSLILDLPPTEGQLWQSFPAKVRNQVRKATKSGLTVEIVTDASRTNEFLEVFTENMRDLGSPTHSPSMFRLIIEVFQGNSVLFLVTHKGQTIGGAIGLFFRDMMEVPWASSLRRFFPLCPNNLLYWEAMRYGLNRGCRTFNFGSSPKGSGTYRFKKQWGARPVPIYRQYVPCRSEAPLGDKQNSLAYRVFQPAWRHLPAGLATRLGPLVMRHIPL